MTRCKVTAPKCVLRVKADCTARCALCAGDYRARLSRRQRAGPVVLPASQTTCHITQQLCVRVVETCSPSGCSPLLITNLDHGDQRYVYWGHRPRAGKRKSVALIITVSGSKRMKLPRLAHVQTMNLHRTTHTNPHTCAIAEGAGARAHSSSARPRVQRALN